MPLPAALRQRRTWLIAVPVLAFLVAVVGPFVYITFIEGDPPARLTLEDTATTTTAGSGTTSAPADGVDGTWTVGGDSIVGYRVSEVLFGQDAEATGRTGSVTGSFTIAGTEVSAASFEVDMTTIASNQSRRDGQFHGRIMQTGTFPTATFELTAPITLDHIPADGEVITIDAAGDFTLKGVTKSVTFPLKAQRAGSTIKVNGSFPVAFDDYGIDDPSGGPATVKDDAEMELLLVLTKAP